MANNPVSDQGGINTPKNLPEQIPSIEPQEGTEPSEDFSSMSSPQEGNVESQQSSPMNVAHEQQAQMHPAKASTENLMSGMKNALAQMEALQGSLQTPKLKLNKRTTKLLKAKFKRTQDNLNFISSKLNAGDKDEEEGGQNGNQKLDQISSDDDKPAEKLVSWLVDGQSQLRDAMQSARNMGKDKKHPELIIADAFALQVKMYRAQVELEFSTAVIQKSIEDLKTLMSVQL